MTPTRPARLTLPVPDDFQLERAVCSYGYFLLAPNHWAPDTQTFSRPMRIGRRLVHVRITQRNGRLQLACDRPVKPDERRVIKDRTARMLRLDEDLAGFHRLHPAARSAGFGRMFRSPTLFEDIIKTITGCNVTWTNTRTMNRLLCQHVGKRGFPTPQHLAKWSPEDLKAACKVGYRAERMIRLARDVVDGRLDLDWFEHPDRTTDELYRALLAIHGLGPYAAANLLQLLGHYDRVAIDTETYRHYCKTYDVPRPKDPTKLHPRIIAHYSRYAPYDFLAYWFELWVGYEDAIDKPAHDWTHADGSAFTVANLKDT